MREMVQPDCSSDEEKVSKEGRSCKVTCRWQEDEQHQERGYGQRLGYAYQQVKSRAAL